MPVHSGDYDGSYEIRDELLPTMPSTVPLSTVPGANIENKEDEIRYRYSPVTTTVATRSEMRLLPTMPSTVPLTTVPGNCSHFVSVT
ncbi:hypothetical protein J6590_008724 [Homalodisca vitripennis]|nr:hypothetical protein J6590_008724 [Homalodisca vitripennis]